MIKTGCTFITSSLKDLSFGYDTENENCIFSREQLRGFINKVYSEGVRDFYSICEEGIDLWAAEEVTELMKKDESVKLHCILPYEDQASKWFPEFRELYYSVLEKATDTCYISLHYTENCVKEARYKTLDSSHYVFAFPKSDKEFLDYALNNNKEVFVDPEN